MRCPTSPRLTKRVGKSSLTSVLSLLLYLFWAPTAFPQTPCTLPGSWESPFRHEPGTGWGQYAPNCPQSSNTCFEAIHMALIPAGPDAGKVLVFDLTFKASTDQNTSIQRWAILDLGGPPDYTQLFYNFALPIPHPGDNRIHDLFCAGHAWMADGKLLVAGGTRYISFPMDVNYEGAKFAYVFDPLVTPRGNGQWTALPPMDKDRWYPTVTLLGDANNRVVVTGGWRQWPHYPQAPSGVRYENDDSTNSYEVWNPAAPPSGAWETIGQPPRRSFYGPRWDGSFPQNWDTVQPLDEYPRMFLLSNLVYNSTNNSRLFMAGMRGWSASVDHAVAPEVWSGANAPQPAQQQLGKKIQGSAVLFPGEPDMVMHVGGEIAGTPTNNVEYIRNRVPAAQAVWVQSSSTQPPGIPAMYYPRTECNGVILPDESVIILHGRRDGTNGVREPELLRDGTWCVLPPETSPRAYHSTAVLLPDGRVLSGGGDLNSPGLGRIWDYQIYRPWYFTNPNRPTWGSFPSVMTYNWTYSATIGALPPGVYIEKVVLIAPGSVTHHSDMHQRYWKMTAQPDPEASNSILFTTPPDATHAPRGYYMMFLVTNGRVPSVAQFVRLT